MSGSARGYAPDVRPLPAPFDRLAAGLPAEIGVSGSELLNRRLLTKDLAFPLEERSEFGLHGLLPDRILSIDEQLALERLHRYLGVSATSSPPSSS